MGAQEDITGQKFGRLTAIKKTNISGERSKFLCKCDCGGEKECRTVRLKNGEIRSCGCLQKETRELQTKDITGQTFGRLFVLKRNGHLERMNGKTKVSAYLCQCICGKTKTISGSDLRSGHTTSCGCGRAVDDPRVNSAKQIYKRGYNDGNLTFEQFMELTQQNCYYCNATPTNNHNDFKIGAAVTSQLNGNFNYNGLDRVNSNLVHDFENLVPCCKVCNKAKGERSFDDFKNHIIKSYNHMKSDSNMENIHINKYTNLLNKFEKSYNRKQHPAVSSAFKIFDARYSDGNLTFEKFLELTQYNCVYCGSGVINKCNKFLNGHASQYSILNGDFTYNGLDRICSNIPHDEENLVTACKTCNWVKCNMDVDEYKNWISSVYLYSFKFSQI